jgi:opacity protein-like surface antigen
MTRIGRAVLVVFAIVLLGSATAFAQPSGASTWSGYAQFDVAATFGHKSDKALGGEAGYEVRPGIDVFAEGGHIGNAASADLESGANLIANAVGATANAITKVNYFDVGVRYRFTLASWPTVHPYAAIGIGAAHLTNQTTFSINGTTFSPDALGIQLGADLNGSETKAYLMLGGGAMMTFGERYLVDLSYRWGGVLGATDAITGSGSTLSTNRLQFGIGLTF